MKYLFLITLIVSKLALNAQIRLDNEYPKKWHQSLGIQMNPFIINLDFKDKGWVSAVRYSLANSSGVSFGAELSYNYYYDWERAVSHNFHGGGFCRYTFLRDKTVRPFIEVNGYFSLYQKTQYNKDSFENHSYSGWFPDEKPRYFVAPGVSFYLFEDKFSMSLMVKLNNNGLPLGGYKALPSFRIHYHF